MKKFTFLLVVSVFSACVFASDGFRYPTADTLEMGEVNLSLLFSNNVSMGLGENFEVGGAFSYCPYKMGIYTKGKLMPFLSIGGSYLPTMGNLATIYGVYEIQFEGYDLNLGLGAFTQSNTYGFEIFSVGRKKLNAGYLIVEAGYGNDINSTRGVLDIGAEETFDLLRLKSGLLWEFNTNNFNSIFPILPYVEIGFNFKFGG